MSNARLHLLIIGGYGVFGGRLARLLADEPRLTILIGGRSIERAQEFCATIHGAAELAAVRFDRASEVATQLGALKPDVVVDASGPFQDYGDDPYLVVRAAIAERVHYFDLADGSDFVNGVAQFDDAARSAGIYVLSGVSSFPVLTAAVVRHLTTNGDSVETVTGGIAPSPYAGVGLNVIKAISSYAGKRVALTRDGKPGHGFGISETVRYTIAPPGRLPLHNTLFSLVDVPDLRLLPHGRPELKSIWMGAGPVPEILHRMLLWLTWTVRARALPSLTFAAPLVHRAINILRWGEHRGGMFVEITGRSQAGIHFKRSWHLLAEGDDGPFIPSMAIEALIRKQLNGDAPAHGARSAIDALELADYRKIFALRTIYDGVRLDSGPDAVSNPPIFQRALGDAWQALPKPIRAMHKSGALLLATGRGEVGRGKNPLTWLVGTLFGFPASSPDVPVTVEIQRDDGQEIWIRRFGNSRFSSRLKPGSGRGERLVNEQFGPFTFGIALVVDGKCLRYIIRRWTFLGMPLPRFLAPGGETFEAVDQQGRFTFNVEIRLPLLGRLVSYNGYLEAAPGKQHNTDSVADACPD